MSTRGTYLLPASREINNAVCFYIHHDNYPQGAAHYFLQMHYFKNPLGHHGHYADRFFRANRKAEFAGHAHDFNADVEYCYTLNVQGQLTVLHRPTGDYRDWDVVYKGLWYEFVNQQLPDKETLYAFKMAKDTEVMTLTEARNFISEEHALAKKAFDKGAILDARFYENEAKLLQTQVEAILPLTKPECYHPK